MCIRTLVTEPILIIDCYVQLASPFLSRSTLLTRVIPERDSTLSSNTSCSLPSTLSARFTEFVVKSVQYIWSPDRAIPNGEAELSRGYSAGGEGMCSIETKVYKVTTCMYKPHGRLIIV